MIRIFTLAMKSQNMFKNCYFKNKNKIIFDKLFTLKCINIKKLIIKLAYIYFNNKNSFIFFLIKIFINMQV